MSVGVGVGVGGEFGVCVWLVGVCFIDIHPFRSRLRISWNRFHLWVSFDAISWVFAVWAIVRVAEYTAAIIVDEMAMAMISSIRVKPFGRVGGRLFFRKVVIILDSDPSLGPLVRMLLLKSF